MRDQYWQDNLLLGMPLFFQLHLFCVNGKISGNLACIGELQGAGALLCSPRGCGFHYRYHARSRHRPFYELECADLRDCDVIFGAEQRMEEAVLAMDRQGSYELIFLLPSVVSDVMSEDLAGLARQLQPRVRARLVPVTSQAFSHMDKSNARRILREKAGQSCDAKSSPRAAFPGCGYVEVMEALVEQVMEPQPREPLTVNIESFVWGYNGAGKLAEMEELLGKMGVRVNSWLPAADLAALRRAPRAALNVVRRKKWALAMEQRFGTPFLHVADMQEWHGVQGITDFYTLLGERLGIRGQVEQVLQAEHARVAERLAELRAAFAGLSFCLVARSLAAVPDLVRVYQRDYGLPLRYICIVQGAGYRLEMGIDDGVQARLVERAAQACELYGCRAEILDGTAEGVLQRAADACDFVLTNGAPRYAYLGRPLLDTKFDRSVWTYDGFLAVMEELWRRLQRRRPRRELLLARAAYDQVDYPLRAEDRDSLAAREMFSRLWRQRYK